MNTKKLSITYPNTVKNEKLLKVFLSKQKSNVDVSKRTIRKP